MVKGRTEFSLWVVGGGVGLFRKICKGKKNAALVITCNGISQKGCECAAPQCMLSRRGFLEVVRMQCHIASASHRHPRD